MVHSEPPPFTFTPRSRRRGGLVVAALLMVGGSAGAGYGIGLTVIDENGDAPVTYVAADGAMAATLGGLLLAVVGAVAWLIMMDRFPRALSSWHALGLLLVPAAPGLVVAARELGVGGWYDVVAAALATVGVLALLGGSLLAARRRLRWLEELRLIAVGTPTVGTVVDSGLDPDDFEEASNVITTSSFRFTAADGTSYLVHRRVTVPAAVAIHEGQRTTVWYDPANPLDDRRIVVAMIHALRWNVPVPGVPVEESVVPS
ncbi:DUF3592 domain-containing protein [Nocardioides nitrophenolicus]|uniref:DUF3592 domain-containing protein n=1 Tax=Nocardioides nitrophenolicus TaxID=60489 RepID=UPI00195EC866|nr:DUF3592 domain-containing protein [Nocardioides nitrophenolicus]MBM7516820.1 hypothetical protein [Nocardioides nitrophenolicus]